MLGCITSIFVKLGSFAYLTLPQRQRENSSVEPTDSYKPHNTQFPFATAQKISLKSADQWLSPMAHKANLKMTQKSIKFEVKQNRIIFHLYIFNIPMMKIQHSKLATTQLPVSAATDTMEGPGTQCPLLGLTHWFFQQSHCVDVGSSPLINVLIISQQQFKIIKQKLDFTGMKSNFV